MAPADCPTAAIVRSRGMAVATRLRLMAVESGRSVPRAANPGRPDIAVTRADETMMHAVAQRPVTTGRRPEAAEGVFRGMSPGAAIR